MPSNSQSERPDVPFQILGVAGAQPRLARDVYALSSREEQVLRGMWIGQTDAEIGYELGLGLATVRQYKQRLQVKVGAKRPSQIISRVVQGLTHLDVT